MDLTKIRKITIVTEVLVCISFKRQQLKKLTITNPSLRDGYFVCDELILVITANGNTDFELHTNNASESGNFYDLVEGDITSVEIEYNDGACENYHVRWHDWEDYSLQHFTKNEYQTESIDKKGCVYIVISSNKTVSNVFPELE